MKEATSVLVINPGATSTKIAWFEGESEVFSETLRHSDEELDKFARVADQRSFRVSCVLDFLRKAGRPLSAVSAVAARGGLLPGLEGGTYLVDQAMVSYLERAPRGEHASNLGAPIAWDLAREAGVSAYVTDPVSVDEMEPEARLSGYPPVERVSLFHALNIRAVARRHAQILGREITDLDLVVCHLGTGISLAALRGGRAVDVVNPRDEGPMAMDRAGSVPVVGLLKHMSREGIGPDAMVRDLFGRGGLFAYLGTRDLREVERRMDAGDELADLVFRALAYQVAKAVGAMASVLSGRLDALVFTGGMAHSERFMTLLEQRVGFLGPVAVYPGEDEMRALAEGAVRVLEGREEVRRLAV